MISIKNLFKNYMIGKEKIPILQNINLEIKQGEFVCILGASGCGKSTLLNVIGGLDQKTEGEFWIDQTNTEKFREKDWTRFRKQGVGFIFQNFNLIPNLTVRENIELAMKFSGCSRECRREKAAEFLDMIGMSEKSDYLPSQLSGGQKQRVAIARALANQPRMILADEPTGALDSKSAHEIMEMLHKINREQGITVVLVTHNREFAGQADRIIHIADGRIKRIDIERNTTMEEEDTILPEMKKAGKISMGSSILMGIKNIGLKKKRSLLTVIGTAVGIVGMVLMIGIGNGAKDKIDYELRSFVGDETVWVSQKDEKLPMEDEDIAKLKEIQGVETVLDNHLFLSTYYYKDISAEGQMDVLGPKEQRTDYEQKMADTGKIPETDESREIVLTSQIAEALVGKNSDTEELLGKKIRVLTKLILNHAMTYEVEEEFTVTGIRDTGIIAGASFIPYDTARDLAIRSARTEPVEQKGAEVRVESEASYDGVVEAIRDLGYQVATNKDDFESINMLVFVLKAFLIFVAAIAVLVSAIMIKIVLHTNVMERKKEIGIMCAIGGGQKEVKRIFMAEAGVLGMLSGITGIVLGQILGEVLNMVLHETFPAVNFNLYQMRKESMLLCLAISVVMAILAGRKPAKKAAKISPAETLRYE